MNGLGPTVILLVDDRAEPTPLSVPPFADSDHLMPTGASVVDPAWFRFPMRGV